MELPSTLWQPAKRAYVGVFLGLAAVCYGVYKEQPAYLAGGMVLMGAAGVARRVSQLSELETLVKIDQRLKDSARGK